MTDLEKYEQLFDKNPIEGFSVLRLIIESNDVAALRSYIKNYPEQVFLPTEMIVDSAFSYATADERLDVLRVLLDLADTNGLQIRPIRSHDYSLLDIACGNAQLNTVKFLLDRSPPLGARYASDSHGGSALLSAASSFRCSLSSKPDLGPNGQKIWLRDEIARSEEIVYMLLDKGASVQNAVRAYSFSHVEQDENSMNFIETALGHAASRASYQLVSRLIAEGAEVHARQYNWSNDPISDVGEVTALHIASGYGNLQGIKALLDNCDELNPADMVSMRDAGGCIPLHWAHNICYDNYYLSDDEIASQTCDTLELLIQTNPKTINAQSKDGATSLFSTIQGHADCGGTKHLERIVRLLCEKGADAGIRDITGQNVLHILAARTIGAKPVNPSILDLLVAHGAKVNDADLEGNTPLHHMARSLRQVDLIRRLIHHGAGVSATNAKGETPLQRAVAALALAQQNMGGSLGASTHARRAKAHGEVLEILQEAGCRMDQPNIEGKTPYQLLEDQGIMAQE
jgi:ankyrin repeat protein